MVKVVIIRPEKGRKSAPKAEHVGTKRVRDAATGRILTMRTIDARSDSFSNDLTYVFTRNVAKARRENKQVTGAADRVPAKV
jgi:hypothetical protein